MQDLWRNLGQSLRGLARSPALTATIVATVGLGIGATTVLFGVVHAVLIQPLPYADASRLVRIFTDAPPNRFYLSVADYLALEEQQSSFEQLAGYRNTSATVSRGDLAERVPGKLVTWSYFPVLGLTPHRGRLFDRSDAAPGAERAVVVSYGFWAGRLGGDEGALGRSIRLDGSDYTLVESCRQRRARSSRDGVLRADALGAAAAEGSVLHRRRGPPAPGVERAAAQEELRAINRRIFPIWQASYQDQKATWGAMDLKEHVIGDVGRTLLARARRRRVRVPIACTNAAEPAGRARDAAPARAGGARALGASRAGCSAT